MTAVWLKILHIGALSIWCGGLLALPGLLAREYRAPDGDAEGLGHLWQHRMSRFAYDVIVSPAAVIAIASGTALLFVTRPLEGWMFLKLAAVAGLVVTHMAVGRVIDRIEAPDLRPTRRLATMLVAAAATFIVLILWLVLQKPPVGDGLFPDWLLRGRDGALGQSGSSLPFTPT